MSDIKLSSGKGLARETKDLIFELPVSAIGLRDSVVVFRVVSLLRFSFRRANRKGKSVDDAFI